MDAEEYILGRTEALSSVRLDAQHLFQIMQLGYVLSPHVPIVDGMRIAEIGAGTGIWLLDLARTLPTSIRLDGFDISDTQFPSKKYWSENINFGILDAFSLVPEHLVGAFDVVHLRYWLGIVKGNNYSPLIKHVSTLLKPGGYIQWEDVDPSVPALEGEECKKAHKNILDMFYSLGFEFEWLKQLPEILDEAGFEVLSTGPRSVRPEAVPLASSTFITATAEIRHSVGQKAGVEGLLPEADFHRQLQKAWVESKYEGEIYPKYLAIVARKKC